MKKIIGPLVGVVAIAAAAVDAYLLFFRPAAETGTASENGATASQTQASSGETAEQASAAGLKDGTYTGEVVSTNRGDYQVKMTVASGAITAIDVVEYPQDNGRSVAINGDALPQYTSQALENQSAKVDLVSGASEAYKGFTGSLQDAINQAQ